MGVYPPEALMSSVPVRSHQQKYPVIPVVETVFAGRPVKRGGACPFAAFHSFPVCYL